MSRLALPQRPTTVHHVEASDRERYAVVSFEPNTPDTWAIIQREISLFLNDLYTKGYFAGGSAEDCYIVRCDAETNGPEVVDSGRLVVEIRVAPALLPNLSCLLSNKRWPRECCARNKEVYRWPRPDADQRRTAFTTSRSDRRRTRGFFRSCSGLKSEAEVVLQEGGLNTTEHNLSGVRNIPISS